MKKLATLLAVALLLTTVCSVVTLSSAADGSEVTGGYGYYYNQAGKPVMDFVDPADGAQVGTWWWWTDDAFVTNTRDKYLNFLEENSINEIYYYGYYLLQSKSNRQKLHGFVEEANRHGIAISFIYEENDTLKGSSSALDRVCTEYLTYVGEYPDDKLNGIHFDVEHESVTTFADKIVSQFPNARSRGVPLSMDVNCQMDTNTQVSAGGVTGNIYEVIAANVDTLTLMSYKDSYNAIWNLGAKALAAAKAKGCRVVFGVETGDYSSGAAPHNATFNSPSDEFAQETKEYMYGELAKIYESLQADHPTGGFGVAIHQHEDWYNLKQSDVPITTAGSGKTEKQTVSHASVSEDPTQTTKKTPSTPMEENVLWSGNVNQDVIVGRPDAYTGRLSGSVAEAINAAIRADIAENGTISGDEYYEITTTGSASGSSGYATTGFVVNGEDQLWTEGKVAGTSLLQDAQGNYTQKLFGTTTDKQGTLLAPQMNDTTEFVYFSDASGYTDTVSVDSLVIKVYRHAPYTGTETETETEPTQTSETTPSSSQITPSSSETQPVVTEPSQSVTDQSQTPSSETLPVVTEPSETQPTKKINYTFVDENGNTVIVYADGTVEIIPKSTETEPSVTATGAPSILLGDANDDGAVNMKDVLVMRKALAGMDVSMNNFNADVNQDGSVNMKDVLQIRKFLANVITEF